MNNYGQNWKKKLAFVLAATFIAGCGGSRSLPPERSTSGLSAFAPFPAGSYRRADGHEVDSFGRPLTWMGSKNGWFAISREDGISPVGILPGQKGATRGLQDCVAQASKGRRILDLAPCPTDDGAISTPPPGTVTSLTDLGNGLFSDQNGNNWGYCTSCTDSATGAAGSWIQQIGYTATGGTTIDISIAYDDGFEALSVDPFTDFAAKPPTAYKNYPSRAYIYFNVNHFWARHLACYLKSSQSDFLDAVANDLNAHVAAGNDWPYFDWSFTFKDVGGNVPIEYRGVHFPFGDFVVGTAFIPGKPNC